MAYHAGTCHTGKVVNPAAPASRCHAASSGRAQMMEQLGLHPATQVDGLMTIFRYASNTPALRPRKLVSLLRAQRDGRAQRPDQAVF